jgi:hypothetical protein
MPWGNIVSCAANTSSVFCLGDDGIRITTTPEVHFTGSITSLGVGFDRVCAVSLGEVYCWGPDTAAPVKIPRPL